MAEPHRPLSGPIMCHCTHGCRCNVMRSHHPPVPKGQAGANDSCWTQPAAGGVGGIQAQRPVPLGTCLRDTPLLGKTWTLVPLPQRGFDDWPHRKDTVLIPFPVTGRPWHVQQDQLGALGLLHDHLIELHSRVHPPHIGLVPVGDSTCGHGTGTVSPQPDTRPKGPQGTLASCPRAVQAGLQHKRGAQQALPGTALLTLSLHRWP